MYGLFKWFDELDLSLWKTKDNEDEEPIRIPFKFSYAMGLNFEVLEKFVDAYQKALKKDKDYPEYLKRERDLNERHAKRDEKGKAERTPRGGYVIADPELYGKEFLELREEFKESLEAREEFLAEPETVELYTVDPAHVPEILSPPQIRILIPMIRPKEITEKEKENEQEKEK